MKTMTLQHNKANQPKTGKLCQTIKILHNGNFGERQN